MRKTAAMHGWGRERSERRLLDGFFRRKGLCRQAQVGSPLASGIRLHYAGWPGLSLAPVEVATGASKTRPRPPAAGSLMKRYRWAVWGDVNAFFGLMLDNVAVM